MKPISHVQNTFLVTVSEIKKQNDVMLFIGNNMANTPAVPNANISYEVVNINIGSAIVIYFP
jgi:hypothetical protein